jgi:hypothetical protein
MNKIISRTLCAAGLALSFHAAAQVTFYENDNFRGRSFTAQRQVGNFERFGFNDLASSAKVRGGNWEVCTDAGFNGRCVVLRRGDYPSFRELGLNDQVSSVRPVDRYREGAYDRNGDDRRDYDRRDERRPGRGY